METTDTVQTEETEDTFQVEIAKTLLISAATTAGFLVGIMAVGTLKHKLDQRKERKQNVALKNLHDNVG